MWRYARFLIGFAGFLPAAMLLLAGAGCGSGGVDPSTLIPEDEAYDVTILRDEWGVPHIYGETDADVAYGLAYAHCEDDFKTIQDCLLLARGLLASVQGKDAAPFDYLVKLFRFREIVDREYEKQLSPEVRALCDAYADGYNHYAALHPDEAMWELLPATGKDIVVSFVAKTPLFFGMDNEVERLFEEERPREVATKMAARQGNMLTKHLPVGSNTFSVAPSRTPDGKTHLAVNSHQPWTGPVAWYEVRLKSEEGWDITGGTFPGAPMVLHGHNRELGWAHTVNWPDLVDIYVLETHPDDPDKYEFDGEWRELETGEIGIKVNLWKGFTWTVDREALYSVHGPVIRRPHGTYAIRFAGYGRITAVEQWFRMNKARNLDEFEEALRIRGIPSFNVGYADKAGNIMYLYNALFPKRAEGYDWRKFLPGDTPEVLWEDYLPFDALPKVTNPASGFVQNCNSTPYRTTIGPENPRPENFSPTLGIEGLDRMTNRALRALELFGADESITTEEFYRYKYDLDYSRRSDAAELQRELVAGAADLEDPVVQDAVEALRAWDFRTNKENPNTAIAILTMEPVVRARMFGRPEPDLLETFVEKAHLLHETFGSVRVPWSKVNRLVRGEVNVGMGGGPDVLHAVYGAWNGGHLVGEAGDCYVLMVTWDADGTVRSRSIHQFGSATLDEASPHYADQVPVFIARKTKPVWFEEAELRAHLEAEYRPGEPRPAPKAGALAE